MCVMTNRSFLWWMLVCVLGFLCLPFIFGGCATQMQDGVNTLKELAKFSQGQADMDTKIRAHLPTKASGGMVNKFEMGSEGYVDVEIYIKGSVTNRDNDLDDNVSRELPRQSSP